VLPNIRPIPKSKFVYKGLAYKGTKKNPGLNKESVENTTTTNTDSLKKPLIDYNLAQAYIRYEINAERTKQILLQPSLPSNLSAKSQSLTKTHTSLDLREMRKRIVKGTTLPYRPTPQSAAWTPGRMANKSAMSSEVLLSVRSLTALDREHTVSPFTRTSALPQPTAIHITSS
jgi:hypothetical protein